MTWKRNARGRGGPAPSFSSVTSSPVHESPIRHPIANARFVEDVGRLLRIVRPTCSDITAPLRGKVNAVPPPCGFPDCVNSLSPPLRLTSPSDPSQERCLLATRPLGSRRPTADHLTALSQCRSVSALLVTRGPKRNAHHRNPLTLRNISMRSFPLVPRRCPARVASLNVISGASNLYIVSRAMAVSRIQSSVPNRPTLEGKLPSRRMARPSLSRSPPVHSPSPNHFKEAFRAVLGYVILTPPVVHPPSTTGPPVSNVGIQVLHPAVHSHVLPP